MSLTAACTTQAVSTIDIQTVTKSAERDNNTHQSVMSNTKCQMLQNMQHATCQKRFSQTGYGIQPNNLICQTVQSALVSYPQIKMLIKH